MIGNSERYVQYIYTSTACVFLLLTHRRVASRRRYSGRVHATAAVSFIRYREKLVKWVIPPPLKMSVQTIERVTSNDQVYRILANASTRFPGSNIVLLSGGLEGLPDNGDAIIT